MDELATIQNKIHEIRGQRVMLDYDLAQMYGVETFNLNKAVKRNVERFPDDFMFQLTKGEWEILKSQIGISSFAENQKDTNLKFQNGMSSWGGIRRPPYAFTELGVAMLSSVLRSPQAIQVNIGIMRAFVTMRHAISTMSLPAKVEELEHRFEELKQDIEDILHDQNEINESTRAQLDSISLALAELQPKEPHKPRPKIGFV